MFVLKTDVHIANAIRRTALSHVPIYAIHIVTIKENDSIYEDEFITHRLGLIPIICEDYKCSEISINIEGPKMIYSGDIKFSGNSRCCDNDILILELKENEKLNLIGMTMEGIGKDHSKWSPCCPITYNILNENEIELGIETTGSLTPEQVLKSSIKILIDKLDLLKKELENYNY